MLARRAAAVLESVCMTLPAEYIQLHTLGRDAFTPFQNVL